MARLFIEGFEHGHINTTLFNEVSASFVVSTNPPAGMSGVYCGNANGGWSYCSVTLDSSEAEVYVAAKGRMQNRSGYGTPMFSFRDSAGTVAGAVGAIVDGDHFHIVATIGNQAGTILATGSIEIINQQVVLVEARYKPLNTGGIFQVKVDGVMDINYSGDTTAGLENVKKIRLGSDGRDNYTTRYDDFVVDDADWIGNTRIQKLQISGAGTTSEWDASAGNPEDCIDELPYSDADYVSTNVIDESLTCACADLGGNIDSIKCLAVQNRAAYDGNPTPTQQKIAIRVNGTEYYGADETPGLSYSKHRKIWGINPDDSQPWEEADINAIEIGVRSVT
jgi:hypothetical protein